MLHLRLVWRIAFALALIFIFSTASAAQIFQDTFHDPRMKASAGFYVDLEYPADVVRTFVKNAATSSIIHGTKIYRKDKEDVITEAEPATSSNVFNDTPASGQVFYKVRKNAIAPEHFPGSNSEGTVTVRYVIHPITPQLTRLFIDAVFFQESLRARYFSDGHVESAESQDIRIQLATFTASTNSVRPVQSAAPIEASPQPVPSAVPAPKPAEPENAMVREQSLLADEKAALQNLREQLKQLQFNTQGRVNSGAIPLKSYPYNHSSTVTTLEKDERITVLTTSRYWYRVKTPKGEEGWVYYVFLEPMR